ncbi:MarR family winged helix-turn-helix transcriptional regulator [Gryllotalpicola protaetiae]|uniref:MarR family transcriptional regulator n=1 Tax=Gryllotalpicola protaetiae TaxID=2419771 RepID=A0A387BH18_9MICO|nr:MarR family winged helix-turn-helix transcriptional regulator [Gryllotalpicola protaetiae]AYG03203.1 MarR family transcriptional regulator [Gryllotalpicola protaetiae]
MARTDQTASPSTALPEPTENDFATRLAVAIGRINRRIRPTRDGISHGLVSALGSVVRVGEIRPGDLARLEAVAAPTMTRLVADLEARGLVTRKPDPTDGRSFFVVATDAGIDAIRRARFERAERVAALLDGLPPEQLAAVKAAIDGLETVSQSAV